MVQSRIAITGATGFVGGHIASAYLERGDALRLLVRPSSDLGRLPAPIRRALDAGTQVELFEADLTRAPSLRGFCDHASALVHAACAVKGTFDESIASSRIFAQVNVDGTRNLALEAARAKVRMIHLSSTAAMGPVPAGRVDEETPCNPLAPYQRSKRSAELALLNLVEEQALDAVILRPCLILGPGKIGGEPLQLFRLVQRGLFPMIGGDMSQIKPLIDVRDVIAATRLAMKRGPSGSIYLIHSGAEHRLGDILEVARRLVGARRAGISLPIAPARLAAHGLEALAALIPSFNPPLTPGRLDLFLADRRISIERARHELGFAPAVDDLYEMFGRTYIGYLRDGQLNSP